MKGRTISATELKANMQCVLDEVARTRRGITITKRGRPVATLRPAKQTPKWQQLEGSWAGRIDLPLDPVDLTNDLECLKGNGA